MDARSGPPARGVHSFRGRAAAAGAPDENFRALLEVRLCTAFPAGVTHCRVPRFMPGLDAG
ncbi:hypothetical protein ACF1B0_31650 [Streptomyces anandii]|uniref:hypothetical protein n=1 Tax=Streptomyces anandii TaxID=285454 RepID=UPI0036F65BED